MAILSPEQRKALAGELAKPEYAGMADAAAAAALSTPSEVPNPEPQGQVPRPFSASEVMSFLDPATIGSFKEIAYLPAIIQAINANDRSAVGLWVNQLTAGGVISPTQAGNIMGLLAATIPDPAWPETVPGPNAIRRLFPDVEFPQPGGGSVSNMATAAMVAEARA